MNEATIEGIISNAYYSTDAVSRADVRHTVKHLDGKGLLVRKPAKVSRHDIKRGDWVIYFDIDGDLSETYVARFDADSNYNGMDGEFFIIKPELFGKDKEEVKVEDIEAGTRFRASLLGGPVKDYVRGTGARVFELGRDGAPTWSATNADFKVEKVYE